MTPGEQGKAADADVKDIDHAFSELRPGMLSLAYRITGSRADAEDIVQECFLRLHRAGPKEAIRSLQAYLATITARLSFNRLRDRRARQETYVGEWLPEPALTADEPTSRTEDVSFALLLVLERLSPLERVVFVLRTTFEFEFAEIAAVVGRDASACRKILSRARARVIEGRPRFAVDRDRHRALIRSFRDAVRARDADGLIALLDDKVVVRGDGGGKALTAKKPIRGSAAAARFLIAVARTQSPATAVDEVELNGAPALAMTQAGRLVAAILIDTDGERIRSIFGVANPDKLAALACVMGGAAVSRESREAAGFASA